MIDRSLLDFRFARYADEPNDFAAVIIAYGGGYTGRYKILDGDARYPKIMVERITDYCVAELWIYDKDWHLDLELFLSQKELDTLGFRW
jgi:hypothetical protein